MANEIVPYHQQWYAQVPRSTKGATRAGYAVLVFGVGGFLLWASLAPIDGAVISPGNFVATSQNKTVQHLEGGIIKEILVKEGEPVEQGQPLMRLDDTAARTELARLLLRQTHLMATVARLDAEMTEADKIEVPKELAGIATEAGASGPQPVIESQRQLFEAHRNKLTSDIAIQERGAAALRQRIKGDKERVEAIAQQITLVNEELDGKAHLFKAGLLRKPEFFALQRARLTLVGERGRIQSEIEDGQERVAAAEKTIIRTRQLAVQQAAEDLQSASGELKDVSERIMMARGVLRRVEIRAPVKGIVVKLNYHTPAGVIRPGNDILALLPSGDELIIQVNVRPQDIAHVKVGQEALVRLTALNQRTTPMITGTVVFVSADALPNEKKLNSDNIYVARVGLDPARTAEIKDFLPTPGMPAEVYIKTGRRTFFEYLARPVLDTMSRAFRES